MINLQYFTYRGGVKRSHRQRFKAFTLAEVLITLGIIGVVAALTITPLIKNIEEKQTAEQIRTVKYKFTKATENMTALGLMATAYPSTADFINELKNHLKIIKICDNDKLNSCWPYEKINMPDGTKYKISNIVDGGAFKKHQGDWSSPALGIITADGIPMIITYKKDCAGFSHDTQYAWTFENGKPVTNATTSCIAGIFDINGKSGHNQTNKDVISFGANGLGTDCYNINVNGACFNDPIIPPPKNDCEGIASGCSNGSPYYNGAIVACGGEENLPSREELMELISQIVIDNKFNSELAKKKGIFLEPPFSIIASGSPHPNNKYTLTINTYNPKYPDRTVGSSYSPITTPAYTMCK